MFDKFTTLLFGIGFACVSLAVGTDVTADPDDTNVPLICSMTSPTWEKDNKTIESTDKGYTLIPENGTLIVAKVDSAHMGVYVCKDGNNQIESITLFVRPYVKPFEKSKNMIQADPLQLECKGYGYPIPAVEWYTKGKLLVPDGVRITLKDTPAQQESSVMINGTIRITNMDFDDAGDYECVATNNLDNGVSNATISVKVKDKLAALWPFLGICAEVAILCTIIFIYEKRRTKRMQQEEERAATEEQERLNANNESKTNDDVRQRK